jgi:hypothetical protein
LGLFISNSNRKADAPQRVALPTPSYGSSSSDTSKPYGSASFGTSSSKPYAPSFERSAPSYPDDSKQVDTAPSAPSSTYENQVQPTNYKVLLIKMCDVLDRVLWMQTWMSQEIAWIIRMYSMLFIFPYSFCGGYLHITCLSWVIRLLSNKAYKWHQLHVLHSFMVSFYI